MHRFIDNMGRWLGLRSRPTARSKARRPSVRLSCEELESRVVLDVSYHGGQLLRNPHVVNVFLGPLWTSDSATRNMADYLSNSIGTILQSGYIDGLQQYGLGGGFRGSVVTQAFDPDANWGAGSQHSGDDLDAKLSDEFARGPLSQSLSGAFIMIFVQPGVTGSGPLTCGYHIGHFIGGIVQRTVFYGVVTGQVDQGGACGRSQFGFNDNYTAAASHELVEALTDPNQDGWWDPSRTATSGEIGDLCSDVARLGGILVQKYYSNQMHGCDAPGTNGAAMRASVNGRVNVQGGRPRAGVTVRLMNNRGTVMATQRTNARGSFAFSAPRDFRTSGNFRVQMTVPSGFQAVTSTTRTVSIPKPGATIRNVNFMIAPRGQSPDSGGRGFTADPLDAGQSIDPGDLQSQDALLTASAGQNIDPGSPVLPLDEGQGPDLPESQAPSRGSQVSEVTVDSMDAELGQDLALTARSNDPTRIADNPSADQTAALFAVHSEFPSAALGTGIVVSLQQLHQQVTQDFVTPSQATSTDAVIDTIHVGRSGQAEAATRDLLFSQLHQEQRDSELGIDLFTAA